MLFETKVEHVEICGKSYPYICDILVLEKIQNKYGDLTDFEDGVYGVVPYFDENGERDRKKDKRVFPNIDMVISSFLWMIEEGLAVTKEKLKVPIREDLMRQQDLQISQMVALVISAYSGNFSKAQK